MKKIFQLILITLIGLVACSPSGPVAKTKINIEFPFEPGFPGYLVDVSSKSYTANLMCALSKDGKPGEVQDIDDKTNRKLGVCDTKSMTLDMDLGDKITVTVILGGFPFIMKVTQSPSRIVDISDPKTCPNCKQAEFDFKTDLFKK